MKKLLLIMGALLLFASSSFAIQKRVILSPKEAFSYSVKRVGNVLHVNVTPALGIYVYDDKLKFEVIKPKQIDYTSKIKRPKPISYQEHLVHMDPVDVEIPIAMIKKDINDESFTFRLSFQGCAKAGICYSPMHYDYMFFFDE